MADAGDYYARRFDDRVPADHRGWKIMTGVLARDELREAYLHGINRALARDDGTPILERNQVAIHFLHRKLQLLGHPLAPNAKMLKAILLKRRLAKWDPVNGTINLLP